MCGKINNYQYTWMTLSDGQDAVQRFIIKSLQITIDVTWLLLMPIHHVFGASASLGHRCQSHITIVSHRQEHWDIELLPVTISHQNTSPKQIAQNYIGYIHNQDLLMFFARCWCTITPQIHCIFHIISRRSSARSNVNISVLLLCKWLFFILLLIQQLKYMLCKYTQRHSGRLSR